MYPIHIYFTKKKKKKEGMEVKCSSFFTANKALQNVCSSDIIVNSLMILSNYPRCDMIDFRYCMVMLGDCTILPGD